jgi:sugar-specific transcriptional regulator TrmB
MDTISAWLRSYGLNDTEIAVYLYLLAHPEAKVADIQRHTSLVRTTIYYALAQLKTDGLVSESQQNNVKTYRAADATTLEHRLETKIVTQQKKLQQLDDLRPLFEQIQKQRPKDTESFVARFEGTGPVKQAIEHAFRCESKHWHVVASRHNFLYHSSKAYQQYYLEERKRRGITAKTLWEPTDDLKIPSVQDIFWRNPRLLPREFRGAFTSLVILYDDTTLIIDPYEQRTAHAIHNKQSTQLLRMLLESAWKSATPINNLVVSS